MTLNDKIRRFQQAARQEMISPQQVVQMPGLISADQPGAIRKAFCKNDAGASHTIACYLDEDQTGEEVTVICTISGVNNLNSAIPRLAQGDLIFVAKFAASWYCLTIFQSSEECECVST